MFKHQGRTRTLKHNLSVASLLSFVAGMVNVVGFIAVQRLTTNVTGHFAFLVDEVFKLNFSLALVYFSYIFFFFIGSFSSSFLIELMAKKHPSKSYVLPILIEAALLIIAAIWANYYLPAFANVFACLLLFAMGLQNSLVTSISNSAVRTTHLTGLFTDLGIELSQLFFYKQADQQKKLKSSIALRLTIILFFFIGGLMSGILYSTLATNLLFVAASILLLGLIIDRIDIKT